MHATQLEGYVSGGYFLVRPYWPPEDSIETFLPKELVSRPVVTLATCFAEILPAEWAFRWFLPVPSASEREAGARAWNIPVESVPDVVAWADARRTEGRIFHHDAFANPATAAEFARRFLPEDSDALLLGIGLHRESLDGLPAAVMRADEAMCGRLGAGCTGAPSGVLDAAAKGVPMAPGGIGIGFDVLDVCLGEGRHSWHCHSIEREAHSNFGTPFLRGGLIDGYEHARRIAAWCDSGEAGTEPGVWRAWLVAEYARNSAPVRESVAKGVRRES